MPSRLLAPFLLALLLVCAAPRPVAAQCGSLKFVSTHARPHDYLGNVALDEDWLVAGAPGFGTSEGAVHVFDRASGERRLRLTASNPVPWQYLGHRVAIDDGVVVAGAPASGAAHGSAFVFDAATGEELFELVPSTPLAQSWFGIAVALDARFFAVGAPGDFMFAPDDGTVHLFDRASGLELRRIRSPDPSTFFVPINHFGESLDLEQGLLLVGATGVDLVGAAYLFEAATGAQIFKLLPPIGSQPASFGASVDLRGDRAVVGDPSALGARGAAHVYDATTGQLLYSVADPEGLPADGFGVSVALGETLLAVGSAFDDVGPYQGSVHVFDTASGAELRVLLGYPASRIHRFGASLAFQGGQLAVGDPQDSEAALYAGAAYLFQLDPCR